MSVVFLYTGAKEAKSLQDDAAKSLGGFVSGSVIPNSRFAALFSDISYLTVKNQLLTETKAIVIFNSDTDNAITPEITIALVDTANDYEVDIAPVELDANLYMERIGNANDLPINATFQSTSGGLILPTIPPNTYLGIWIRRTITAPNITPANLCQLNDNYVADPNRQFSIDISY